MQPTHCMYNVMIGIHRPSLHIYRMWFPGHLHAGSLAKRVLTFYTPPSREYTDQVKSGPAFYKAPGSALVAVMVSGTARKN